MFRSALYAAVALATLTSSAQALEYNMPQSEDQIKTITAECGLRGNTKVGLSRYWHDVKSWSTVTFPANEDEMEEFLLERFSSSFDNLKFKHIDEGRIVLEGSYDKPENERGYHDEKRAHRQLICK